MAVGAVYQTVTPLLRQDAVPPARVERAVLDDHGDAVGERRDDPVRGPRDPARVRRAPEDVVRVQVEGIAGRHVVREHRTVDVHRPLRPAGRAAGEVQQRHVLRVGGRDLVRVVRPRHQVVQVLGAGDRLPARGADQQDVLEVGQLVAHRGDPAPVERLGGHEHPPVAQRQPLPDRLGAEGGEQRRDDGAVLECAEHGDVQRGDAPGEGEDTVARPDTEAGQDVGEPVGLPAQVAVGHLLHAAGVVHEAQGDVLGPTVACVAVDGLVRDVEPPTPGQPVEQGPRGAPAEGGPFLRVAAEPGVCRVRARDRFPAHVHLRDGRPGAGRAVMTTMSITPRRGQGPWAPTRRDDGTPGARRGERRFG